MVLCKIMKICKDHKETKRDCHVQREREAVEALGLTLQAISFVAREDRDGCSRYRAAKMSQFLG